MSAISDRLLATPTVVVTGIAMAYLLRVMKIKRLPAGFVIPAQPAEASNRRPVPTGSTKSNMTAIELSSAGTVPPCGSTARSRNAYDWTVDWRRSRLPLS
jgi:hypothetical protein